MEYKGVLSLMVGLGLTSAVIWPGAASASSFFESRELVSAAGAGIDTMVPFGGCENGHDCSGITDDGFYNLIWVIGDLGVIQGVYYLPLADDHAHGKLKLYYDYKLTSEDTHADSTDFGRIRIKDVPTNDILYEKVLTPDSAEDWQSVVVTLPGRYATKNLQLVFESNNDDSGLTQLYIRNWSLVHKSEPAITGTITYQVNGETRYAANALVALQNRARTQTLAYVRTNDRGQYTFFPVRPNRRYMVAATLGDFNGLKRLSRKVKYGNQYTADFSLTDI